MAEIINFARRSGSGQYSGFKQRVGREFSGHDRVLVLTGHQRYWEVLASVARQNGQFDQARHFETRAEALFDEISCTKASTIEGAIAQLRVLFPHALDWVELMAAGLREIAARSGVVSVENLHADKRFQT